MQGNLRTTNMALTYFLCSPSVFHPSFLRLSKFSIINLTQSGLNKKPTFHPTSFCQDFPVSRRVTSVASLSVYLQLLGGFGIWPQCWPVYSLFDCVSGPVGVMSPCFKISSVILRRLTEMLTKGDKTVPPFYSRCPFTARNCFLFCVFMCSFRVNLKSCIMGVIKGKEGISIFDILHVQLKFSALTEILFRIWW